MDGKMKNNQESPTRRRFCQTLTFMLLGGAVFTATGCSVFKGKEKGVEQSEAFEIDDKEEEGEEKEDVFAKERKKQREMSDFLAENGRDSKKKSKVRPGDDFLLSSKAKEIYANTER